MRLSEEQRQGGPVKYKSGAGIELQDTSHEMENIARKKGGVADGQCFIETCAFNVRSLAFLEIVCHLT
jgi:hypothetical protein